LKPGEVFYYADEFNISWHPTLRALWSPRGQQVMVSTPMQPIRQYGLGAVNWYTGQTLVITRKHKRRREVAEMLEALLERHKHERIYVAWDNASTHQDEEIEAVVRGAAGRLVLLSLPTYSPWLNPIEMVWRHFRREVTHCELFSSVEALLEATKDFFDRYNRTTDGMRSIIGAMHIPQKLCSCT
jgi:transposase